MKKLFGQEGTSDVPSIATVLAKLQTNNPSVEDYEEGQEPSVAEKAGYQIEKEHCIYVRLIDFGQLREAKEAYKQEQWGVTVDKSEGNALSGKIRVRRSEDPNGNVSYELTVKNRAADGRSSIESTVPSTEEQFKQFKYMSDKGMVKHRYVFDAGNGKQWELDVAPNGDGGWYNWARLELEVDDLEAPLPKLPIKVEEVIMPREKSNLSPEEWKEKTDKIMNKYFVKKNAILENDSEEAKQIAQESFDRAEHVISTKHLTGLAVEGFMDTIKKLFRGEEEPAKVIKETEKEPDRKWLSKIDAEAILKEIKNKCTFTGDLEKLKGLLLKVLDEPKRFEDLYQFEGILEFNKKQNITEDSLEKIISKTPDKIFQLSKNVVAFKTKYAAEKLKKLSALAAKIKSETDPVKILELAQVYYCDNYCYQDMVDEYEDQFLDVVQAMFVIEGKEEHDKFFDKYYDDLYELDWHMSEGMYSDGIEDLEDALIRAIMLFSYDDPTKVATEGFTDELKHFFSFKKKEILGKEKLLESWKNVLKQGNLEGGPSKDKFLGTISSAFDKDEKEIMASFDWEAQLSFMKDKGIDRVSIHKIPMDRLKALSAELKSHRKAYADNKMEVLKKRITEFNNAATLEEAIKLHLGLIEYTQDYDDLLKYMDNIIDVFARIDTSISKDETKAQFDILKEFDSYKGEAFEREVISNVLKASSIFLSRFGGEKVAVEGFVDSVKDMFKNKYQDKTLNTLVKDMKNFTNEPAPKKLDADIETILMSYHEYYVTNIKLAARKKLSMNVNRFKELSTNDPKALDAMSNEVLDEAKKADKGYWPVVDKVQKEVEKAHGWDKVNVLIKFLKETNGDKALYKAHGSIMLQAGVDDVADIYDESNKDDITITKVVDIVWNDNNDDYKVAAMDNPKLSKSLTKMCYKLNDTDN